MIDDQPVRGDETVEAVFYRHRTVQAYEADDVTEALGILRSGEEYGELAPVGVFVGGRPHTYWGDQGPVRAGPLEARRMLADYAKVPRFHPET